MDQISVVSVFVSVRREMEIDAAPSRLNTVFKCLLAREVFQSTATLYQLHHFLRRGECKIAGAEEFSAPPQGTDNTWPAVPEKCFRKRHHHPAIKWIGDRAKN